MFPLHTLPFTLWRIIMNPRFIFGYDLLSISLPLSLNIRKISKEVAIFTALLYSGKILGTHRARNLQHPSSTQFAMLQTIMNSWINDTSRNYLKIEFQIVKCHSMILTNSFIDAPNQSSVTTLGIPKRARSVTSSYPSSNNTHHF